MKKVNFIALFLVSLMLQNLHAQQNSKYFKPLNIGDQCPDVDLRNISNWTKEFGRLSDFGNKIIIIDFFATWCGSCIESLPKLDSLQKAFSNHLAIILVTREDKKTIEKFKEINHIFKKMNFPMVYQDTSFAKLFPHRMIPHDVILDKQRKVIAITSPEHISYQSIQKLINGNIETFELKKDIMDYDKQKPLLLYGNGGKDDNYESRMVLTPYLQGINSGAKITLGKISARNLSLKSLYSLAFGGPQYVIGIPRSFIQIEVTDTVPFIIRSSYAETPPKNLHGYDLSIPFDTLGHSDRRSLFKIQEKLYNKMKDDLKFFFNYTVSFEDRLVDCFSLVYIGKNKNKSYLTSRASHENSSIFELIKQLSYNQLQPFNLPIIDETGLDMNVDFKINCKESKDIACVREELKKYDLDIVRKKANVRMLIISDPKN